MVLRRLRIELSPDAKRKPMFVPLSTFIDVDRAETTANIAKIRIAFNDSDQYVSLPTIAGSTIRCGFDRIALDWDPSEDNKLLVLVVSDQLVRTAETVSVLTSLVPTDFLPVDAEVGVSINKEFSNSEIEVPIEPPDGYLIDLRSMSIEVDRELIANVKVYGIDDREAPMFPRDIDGDQVQEPVTVDAVGAWGRALLRKIVLYVKTKSMSTEYRYVVLRLRASLVRA